MTECPRCGGATEPWVCAHDRTGGAPVLVVCCRACRIGATVPPPVRGPAAATAIAATGPLRRAADAVLRAELRPVQRAVASGARVLDVGAGAGNRARVLRDCGYRVTALEPDPAEAAAARVQLGAASVHEATLSELPPKVAGFDAVLASHVLEHVDDPDTALRDLRACLRPGGVLVAMVPNPGSVEARVFRGRWHGWEPSRHRWHFTAAVLGDALRDAGFAPIFVRPVGGWRYPATLLFSLAPRFDPQVSATPRVVAAALAAFVAPLAAVAAATGRGPQLVAIARAGS